MPKPWLNRLDLLQVNAFKSIYCQNLRLGQTTDEAFTNAIAATSDKIFKKADPELVKRYLKEYGKTKHRIKNRPAYVGG